MSAVLACALLQGACGRIGFDGAESSTSTSDSGLADGDALVGGDALTADAMFVPGMDVVVASGTNEQRNPALVATATGFAVVYDELVGADKKLRVAGLSPTGDVTSTPVTIATTEAYASYAAVIHDGTELAIAWEALNGGKSNIWFGHVALDGTLTDEVQISQATQLAYNASIVWTGSEYGIAWDQGNQNSSDIWFARVSAAGALVGSPVQRSNTSGIAARTSPAWSGSDYGIAWESNSSGQYELYFARVSAAGAVAGAVVPLTAAGGSVVEPSLAWNGSEYGVVWGDRRSGRYQILFQRVSATGTAIGMPTVVSGAGSDARRPKLLWLDSRYVVAWSQDSQVHLATVSAAGSVLGARAVANCSPNPDTKLALTRRGSTLGLAWSDVRNGTSDIYVRVVDP